MAHALLINLEDTHGDDKKPFAGKSARVTRNLEWSKAFYYHLIHY
jgi:hypothetical protein